MSNTDAAVLTLLAISLGVILIVLAVFRKWWHKPVTERLDKLLAAMEAKPQ